MEEIEPVGDGAGISQRGRDGWITIQDRALTIYDGRGGALTLDYAQTELRWLGDACQRLLRHSVPAGSASLKVTAANACYLLTRRTLAGVLVISIANLYDPAERVTLTGDIARRVAALW